jgi:hypothetical protein
MKTNKKAKKATTPTATLTQIAQVEFPLHYLYAIQELLPDPERAFEVPHLAGVRILATEQDKNEGGSTLTLAATDGIALGLIRCPNPAVTGACKVTVRFDLPPFDWEDWQPEVKAVVTVYTVSPATIQGDKLMVKLTGFVNMWGSIVRGAEYPRLAHVLPTKETRLQTDEVCCNTAQLAKFGRAAQKLRGQRGAPNIVLRSHKAPPGTPMPDILTAEQGWCESDIRTHAIYLSSIPEFTGVLSPVRYRQHSLDHAV